MLSQLSLWVVLLAWICVAELFWSVLLLSQARAKTCIGENTGLDVKVQVEVKVPVPDVKVSVPDEKALVPGFGSTGPSMWKDWSLDVPNQVRKCCRRI